MTSQGWLRWLVLGLLRDGVPRHGYAIMRAYRQSGGLEMTGGNVYRTLRALRAEGLVCAVPRTPGEDERRCPYRVTEPGALAFDVWLAGDDEAPGGTPDDGISARVLFLARAEPDVGWTLLDAWQEQLRLRERALERAGKKAAAVPGEFPALALLLSRRARHVAADLEFLQELRAAYLRWTNGAAAPEPARARRS
jgi:DNA-binding PadR family transcriptional regulator